MFKYYPMQLSTLLIFIHLLEMPLVLLQLLKLTKKPTKWIIKIQKRLY